MDKFHSAPCGLAETPHTPPQEYRELMDVFSKIVTGRATPCERERYLAAWHSVTVARAGRRALRKQV